MLFKKKKNKKVEVNLARVQEMQKSKNSIFTPEFAYFIDCIGSEGIKHEEDFDEEYSRMCRKVMDVLEGERTAEVILALAFHLTSVMSVDEYSELLEKIKKSQSKTPSYIG